MMFSYRDNIYEYIYKHRFTKMLIQSINGVNSLLKYEDQQEKEKYKDLRDSYLTVYFLATFSNWLQGPYIYRVYSDYGWSDDSIAYLYVTKYATNCLFGLIVGQLADRCGRKLLCTCYTVFFIICCLTKLSSNFFVLLCGKFLGGISTSILYSVFEAWYLNEHLNFNNFPSDWLNMTFSKATVYNGVAAILAGLTGQILVEFCNLSPLASSLMAIPFLTLTFFKIQNWKEHNHLKVSYNDKNNNNNGKNLFKILTLVFNKDKKLLLIGTIQCLSETVMYVFIFSWTPILSFVGLPLGLVFTSFMVALMSGSHFYKFLILRKISPQKLLTFSIILASISFLILQTSLKQIQYNEPEQGMIKLIAYTCLISFILYEFSLGIYYPSIGYLRGRIIPEEYRATLINWFRVPMNIITCICLILTEGKSNFNNSKAIYKSQILISVSSILLIANIFLSRMFSKEYNKKLTEK